MHPQLTSPPATCLGREAELERLTTLYNEARERGERLALLDGPSGVGKSRILQEFRSRMRLEGGVVLEGRAEPGKAFAPFAEIVAASLRFLVEVGVSPSIDLSDLACSEGCHPFWHMHGGDATVSNLTDAAPRRPRASLGEIDALERRLRFFDAIRGLVRDVASVRVPVVVIHELGRADLGTLQLLQYLLEGANPWTDSVTPQESVRALFVGSIRAATSESEVVAALRSHPHCTVIPVSTLTAEGVRQVLASPELVARVLERTGGLPESIELLLDAEPPTPEARLERRMRALSEPARALVQALAVLELPSDVDVLVRVASISADASVLGEFGRFEALARTIADGKILFRFARERDRGRVYDAIPAEARARLHQRSLEVVRDRQGDAQEAARHALRAGDPGRAVPIALEAAESLAARHAHGEAAALLESLVESAPESSLAPLRERLADLYRVTGEYKRAIAHAKALRVSEAHDAAAARLLGELLTLAGEHEAAAVSLHDALALATDQNDPAMIAETYARLAELDYQRAAYGEARAWAQQALEASSLAGNLALEIHARNTLGKLALAQREAAEAQLLFEENRRKSGVAGLGHQEAQALTNLGVALLNRQNLSSAEDSFRQAIEVATSANDTRERAIATENLAVLAHMHRDYADALTRYHEAVNLLKRLGNRAMLARVANNLGELYLSLGDGDRANMLCDFAAHVGGSRLPPSVLGEGLLLRGRVAAYEGNAHSARASLQGALDAWRSIGALRVTDALLELARLDLADGNVPAAQAVLDQIATPESPVTRAELALVGLEVDRAAGNETLSAARGAVDLAQAASDDEVLLQAVCALARAHLDRGESVLATRAIEHAQQVDARLAQHVPESCRALWTQRPARLALARLESIVSANDAHVSRTRSSVPPAAIDARPAGAAERWHERYPDLVGTSLAIQNVLTVLDKVSASDCLVLVRGESGTGKELVAEALHRNSPRRDKPLVKVNCAALVETLLLSELFGHERGAFTGAQARKKGRFELADGGTLFLDEIGDISPKTQVALLRVLQEREFERVGGTQAIKVDVRIVAATHRDLEKMVREGAFREDLYYRLRGVSVEMPPLRRRVEDLGAVASHLLARIAEERGEELKSLSPDALRLLGGHRWPGNVRELDNVLRSATLFADGLVLTPQDFAAFAEAFHPPTDAGESVRPSVAMAVEGDEIDLAYKRIRGGDRSLFEMKKDLERECIVRALSETGGNITRAAALLGMKRPRLSQLVKQYGLSHAGEA